MKILQQYIRVPQIFISVLAIAFIVSCSDDENSPLPNKGNYFPTTAGSYWKYEEVHVCPVAGDAERICSSISEVWGGGDEHFADKNYDPMSGKAGTYFFVKVIGHVYYMTGYYLPEYKFMDDSLQANERWSTKETEDDFVYDEFTVKEINSSKTIRGKTFTDVVVLESKYMSRNSAGGYDNLSTTTFYYAKGIGKIYSRYTDYTGGTSFQSYLVKYRIAK